MIITYISLPLYFLHPSLYVYKYQADEWYLKSQGSKSYIIVLMPSCSIKILYYCAALFSEVNNSTTVHWFICTETCPKRKGLLVTFVLLYTGSGESKYIILAMEVEEYRNHRLLSLQYGIFLQGYQDKFFGVPKSFTTPQWSTLQCKQNIHIHVYSYELPSLFYHTICHSIIPY